LILSLRVFLSSSARAGFVEEWLARPDTAARYAIRERRIRRLQQIAIVGDTRAARTADAMPDAVALPGFAKSNSAENSVAILLSFPRAHRRR
jgi:hypothetical protein